MGVAAASLAGLVGLSVGAQAAGASPASTATGPSAKVVHVVDRAPVGKMLANTKGLSLYTHPSGACTGSCLSVWPAVVMPKGKTMPEGVKCLSTVAFGKSGHQVTYDGQRLYTFVNDSGTSVNGNGVGGFVAATLVKGCG
jgi:predicted lipoprotein with Yx(FWY)xxD motif